MKLFKSIISGFMAIAIAISLTVPAFAVDPGLIVSGMAVAPDFGSWLWDTAKTGGNLLAGFIDNDNYCPGAGTSLNGRHDFAPQHTQVNGKTGTFYICQNCGLSAGEVLEPAYDTYVESLPFPGYTSSGGLVWQPTCDDVSEINISNQSGTWNVLSDCVQSSSNISFTYNVESRPDLLYSFVYVIKNLPVSGMYRYVEPLIIRYRYLSGNAQVISGIINGKTVSWTRCGLSDIYACYSLSIRDANPFPYNAHVSFEFVIPALEVVPDSTVDFGSDTYSTTTRPTSITGGNYGIVGDNGQITKVEDNSTIVNETNNTYYNPATGTTVPITGWSYDYSDRSYKLTLEGGKTSNVTYGDESITIVETTVNESGDTITNNYTIYYLIEGSGSETPVDPPGPCEHTWTETSTTAPTCTLPGSKLSTCSKCQQTKKEAIPALGHDWQVKQTVTTEYDESGQLTQQGYTIFECSRCHEQYKSTDGTIPPGGGSGTDPGEEDDTTIGGLIEKLLSGLGSIVGGIIKGLLSLLTKAVEALAGLAELFTTFVSSLVDLWGGFTSFLSAVFPFLPEEFIIIIELGLILVIAAAVFRKFLS